MLDGCEIEIEWPERRCDRVRTRLATIRWRQASEANERRQLNPRYFIELKHSRSTKVRTTSWNKLKARRYQVISSRRKAGYHWQDDELQALVRRREEAGEGFESIGRSIGRTGNASELRFTLVTDPAYAVYALYAAYAVHSA